MNHLLKAPFCVHPKTGRVSVPFDASTVDTFDPLTHVPTIELLAAQLTQTHCKHAEQRGGPLGETQCDGHMDVDMPRGDVPAGDENEPPAPGERAHDPPADDSVKKPALKGFLFLAVDSSR